MMRHALIVLAISLSTNAQAEQCPERDVTSLVQVSLNLTMGEQRSVRKVALLKKSRPDEGDNRQEAASDQPGSLRLPQNPQSPMQLGTAARAEGQKKDLVFMHVPYNFGHTVELAAALPPAIMAMLDISQGWNGADVPVFAHFNSAAPLPSWIVNGLDAIVKTMNPNSELWGRLNPDLQAKSSETGCALYFTPPKYWPEDVAQKYFGSKNRFGLLRDPYEMLVARFRGFVQGYGGDFPREYRESCDVNAAVKYMMNQYINETKSNPDTGKFMGHCSFLPQAEYFEGKYGINIPVDNRFFPDSVNSLFEKHGYDYFIPTKAIAHVRGCDDKWAADLLPDTRLLVQQVYKKDFELLCKYFGYCNLEENCCLTHVPHMCPETDFTWNADFNKFQPKS